MRIFATLLILISFSLTNFVSAQISTATTDTINQKDSNNKKQGYWIRYYDDAKTKVKEEGRYENNKKQGVWKQ